MWDLDGKAPSHIANYETVHRQDRGEAKAFGKPVLLINGDSHNYRSDNPLKAAQPCVIESGAAVDQCSDDAWKNHASRVTTSRTSTGLSCTAARFRSSTCA